MKINFTCIVALAGLSLAAVTANAVPTTYDLAWSGDSFGDSAVATGTITMDPSLIIPAGYNDNSGFFFPANPFASALSITISGASSGNGTFNLSDFDTILFNPNGNLNYGTQLVGQPTVGDPWGTPSGSGGDFNLFNRTGIGGAAPDGSFNFTLTTNAGLGDAMLLTSFVPASATPEPGVLALVGSLGLATAGTLRRRSRVSRKA